MSEQASAQTAAANELICMQLLRWTRYDRPTLHWRDPDGQALSYTPAFEIWDEAGLILDALAKADQRPDVGYYGDGWYSFVDATCGDDSESKRFASGPLAIRAAALDYLKAVKS